MHIDPAQPPAPHLRSSMRRKTSTSGRARQGRAAKSDRNAAHFSVAACQFPCHERMHKDQTVGQEEQKQGVPAKVGDPDGSIGEHHQALRRRGMSAI